MRSYQIVEWGQPLEPRDYANPEPTGSEVLLRVEACGVCHSDVHIWQGFFDLGNGQQARVADRGVKLPFTMGHEVVGEVVALGPDARNQGLAIGDKRLVYPWIGCGQCDVCRRGLDLLCLTPRIVGTWRDGGYSDHVLVPHGRYLVDYAGIAPDLACTYACSGLTAWSALKKTGADRAEDKVLLIGAGGVGLNAVHFAPSALPGEIGVADADPAKRAAAEAAGAAWTVDNRSPDAVKAVKDWSKGGVAAVVDFVGRPETAKFGLDVLRKGGTLVVVGLYGSAMSLSVALLPMRMLAMQGSYVGTLDEMKTVVKLAQSGKVPPLRTRPRPLAEANAALADLVAGRVVGRTVLRP
jgi:D-arabinose 1-dehydrogenase-like Zn-dependent alcohol dehydrogenase